MEDEPETRTFSSRRSWFDRLNQAFQREPRDQAQLLELLREAQHRDVLDAEALSMMEGVLEVSQMKVRDVMIPRAQMVILEHDWPLERILQVVIESGHSRLPVVGEDRDEVLGILLAKDLLKCFGRSREDTPELTALLRPTQFIPESKRLNVLLREFRLSRLHIAIVIDEYGGVAGMVTIEDVLEEIVGEIDDEHDVDDDVFIRRQDDGSYTVRALTPIDEFNEHFGSRLSDDEFDTIGGLILNQLGRLPKRGEKVDVEGHQFSVLRVDNRRVHLLRLSGQPSPPSEADPTA